LNTSPRIVVGVDGSPASVAALKWGARQAMLTGSSLDATIGWQYPTHYGNELLYVEDFDWAGVARSTLDAAIAEAGTEDTFACGRTVTEGHPAQVLVRASVDADLLVVGTRGHGGFTGLLLGSVGNYVIAHAACPVLVVRHHKHSSTAGRETP